jgi:hypothetical protein
MKKPKTTNLIPALDLLQTRLECGEYLIVGRGEV